MATLAQQRRAIADGMSSSRAATGESERRATGKRIEAERRGESVVQDLNRLITPVPKRRALSAVQPVGALPAARGSSTYVEPPATGTGGGIASPLTETDYTLREYWPGGLPSTDGLLMFPAEKKVVMADADSAEVIFNYAAPV
jgi:hypothetical protein